MPSSQTEVEPKTTLPPVRSTHKPRNGGPPTVVYFDHTAVMSGGEIALLNLILSIDRTQYTPVVVLGMEGPLADRLREAHVELHILPLDAGVASTRKDTLKSGSMLRIGTALRSLTYSVRLARLLRARKADLIHTNSLKADILGGIAARLACVPVIWHVRDRIADDYLPKFAVNMFRLSCRVIPDYIIANSHATIQTLATGVAVRSAVVHSGSTSRQIRVVHDGIPEQALAPRAALSTSPIIGLVGRISPWKGQHVFIDAAAEILRHYPNTYFQIIGSVMFGEQAYETQIKEQIKRLDLSTKVELTGFCEDVFSRINKLDVLVHASTTGEPFGQVVVEGMVAGKPVVATSGGGIVEIVVDGQTGYLVPMGDARAMAEAVCKLLADPVAAVEMGLRGRTRVLENFTIDITAQKVQNIYAEFFPPL